MDPLSVVSALIGAVKNLYEIAAKVKENREQCLRLCLHINSISDALQEECMGGVPPRLAKRIIKLTNALLDLTITLEGLHKSSFLQRIIWRDQIASKIQELYKYVFEAKQDLKLGIAFDIVQVQRENEDARQKDAAETKLNFDRLLSNDKEILGELEVHKQQMQEAIVCLHRYLDQLPDSVERRYLENGMHALQRRSGPLRIIPDVFVITSLDVIIHYDKKLGQGGFTSVYEAHWRGTRVAVKVMERGVPASAIQREVDVWKRLRHPHILEFFGACSIADPPFMVCAYKHNGDAVDYLRRFPEANRLQLLYEAALGLEYLHSNGVVHGDIKASNILIDDHGRACLSDFGLSQIKIHTTSIRWSGTAPQHGTARWMSPEHMTEGVTNKRTDVYSFGMTMYEMFTGNPPFAATPENMLLPVICDRGVRPSRPEDPTVEKSGLNDEVWELMIRTWAHQPEQRPLASDVLNLLTRHAALVPVDSQDGTPSVGVPDATYNGVHSPPSFPEPSYFTKVGPTHSRMPTVSSTSSSGSQATSTLAAQRAELPKAPVEFPRPPSLQSLATVSTDHGPRTKEDTSGIAIGKIATGRAQTSVTRHGDSNGPKTTTSGQPYVSAGARELIEFLEEGPHEDSDEAAPDAQGAASTATSKRPLGLSRLPQRIVKIVRKREGSDARTRKESVQSPEPSSPQSQASSSRSPVSQDVQVLIDFLDEGPPEEEESSSIASKTSSGPASPTIFGKLPTLGRRSRPKELNLSVTDDLPRAGTRPPPSPQSPGSSSDRSQPYISRSARELVAFLDEGPPPEIRKRQRDASVTSNDSMTSALRIREMFSRGRLAGPADSRSSASRRQSYASSVDPFLPLPIADSTELNSRDDSSVIDISAANSEQLMPEGHAEPPPPPSVAYLESVPGSSLATAHTSSQESRPRSPGVPQHGSVNQLQGPSVGAAAPVIVVLSSLALYMLLFSPLG